MSARPATAADVAAICDICTRAYRETYRGLLAGDYIERVVEDFYRPPRVAGEVDASPPGWLGYQVVEEDGRVLGAAGGGMTSATTGELYVLYLEPAERGRGLGTALLDRVTEQIRGLGATAMEVSVIEGNDKAIPFYRARGFTELTRGPAWGSDESDNVVAWRMRRDLP